MILTGLRAIQYKQSLALFSFLTLITFLAQNTDDSHDDGPQVLTPTPQVGMVPPGPPPGLPRQPRPAHMMNFGQRPMMRMMPPGPPPGRPPGMPAGMSDHSLSKGRWL